MYRMRSWSVRHARTLKSLYRGLEKVLLLIAPLLRRIGYERLDKPFLWLEKATKGFLLDSQSCGQCIVGFTGLACPMNCPKSMRNGPCGGVRASGKCEVKPDMDCVWVLAWEGNKRLQEKEHPIQFLQPAIDNRRIGTSAWLREVRRHEV
ncbi:MAG: methylenetetrahydrofolate reductase C-terminal domain-containing protein [Gammaproteobacteria bacterium]|nr:methylenetetrahydrofolate reductase C-terminal domain-containing protein [Gammaproteobacteria bacterium]MDH5302613.1 methylenetetrahydrofolate reductase C-terminal domain-containing protein [Gammaproteobacteria bacterium]MDH5322126.1 methylenetetrahydrofolate reductase C-terminal domain-containing protein [Gammaproteobacteria bacterium]